MSVDSFRTVSLTSCLAKVVERLINERLRGRLEFLGDLPEHMAGFRRGCCTMRCVLNLVTFVEHERHQDNMSVAVFLDIHRVLIMSATHMFGTAS